jgi:deoxyribodipyrimidine photo-lyase
MWFRRDFRLADNHAWHDACMGAVAAVFIDDPEPEGDWPTVGAARWWQLNSLEVLQDELRHDKVNLVVLRGDTFAALIHAINATGAKRVVANRIFEPHMQAFEERVRLFLNPLGVVFEAFGGGLLVEPDQLANREGKPFRTFSAFAESARQFLETAPPVLLPRPVPDTVLPWQPMALPAGVREDSALDTVQGEQHPGWASGLMGAWAPGFVHAQSQLSGFSPGSYDTDADNPSKGAVSKLSPALHHGELSPGQVWEKWGSFLSVAAHHQGAAAIRRQLLWREFSHHLLNHDPQSPDREWKPSWRGFAWPDDPAHLQAWTAGQTGVPFVDAAMKELWKTGFVHGRARMVAANFLCQHLGVNWREGARWFWYTLVDADLAQNTLNWQWVAGCGADSSPYLRVFNPVTQGETHDPMGLYVRTHLPEIKAVPDNRLMRPWQAKVVPANYPAPVVDIGMARKEALSRVAVFREAKQTGGTGEGGDDTGGTDD